MNLLVVVMFVLICLMIGFGAKTLDRVETDQRGTNEAWRRTHEVVQDAAGDSA